jgi:dihydroflavonol-4-reductase
MKSVLVTGPDGVLGSNLLRELLKRGYAVTAMSEDGKASPTIDDLPINKIGGNLLNSSDILNATKGMDAVIHCAASTSMFPARSEIVNKVNIGGTQNIIDACLANQVKRLIYVGTANSFGSGTLENLGTEKNPYNAFHYGLDYMDSKYKAQELVLEKVRNEGLDAVVVNPTFMIGPYDSRPSSGEMILSIYKKKVPGYTLGGKNFVAVKDVAVAITNAIDKGKSGECYILANENLTYKQAFDKIAATIGVQAPKLKLPSAAVKTIGKLSSIVATTFKYKPNLTYELSVLSSEIHFYSPAKAIAELDLPQTPIEVAIKECFEWFKENDYL